MSSRHSNVELLHSSTPTTTPSAASAAAISTDQHSSIVDLTPSDLDMAGKRKDAAAHAAAVADVGRSASAGKPVAPFFAPLPEHQSLFGFVIDGK